jgi:membrane protease YdiL (CAAX protease family)
MVTPSILVAKDTKLRLSNLKDGSKVLAFLPLTVSALMIYVFFLFGVLSKIYILNLSWLGYNIAIGPFANQGMSGILPFIPLLIYMLLHVNYFEEYYFRRNVKRTVFWAVLHVIMGVAINVVLILIPLGFFYRYIFNKYGINYAYTLHFFTNLALVIVYIISSFLIPES